MFAPAKVRVPEQREVEHRRALVQLEQDEGGEATTAADDEEPEDRAATSSRTCSPRSGRR